ncbi:Aspartate racemase [Bienertia sinuspersici]
MALSFAALRYPLNVVNDVKPTSIRPCSTSSSSSSSLYSSPLPMKTDCTKISPEPKKGYTSLSAAPCYGKQNTVGIIGGVSVLSTLIFLEKFVLWSSRDKHETVPFIVCSDPRMSCLSSGLDRNGIVENLRSKRMFLEEGGAQCIVMPCHISHAWYGEISQGSKLPFLNVAECVAMELKEAKLQPIEVGSGVKVGLIATHVTLVAELYQEKLHDQGFEVVLPDKSTMKNIINPAIHSLKRNDMKGARNLLRIVIHALLMKGVNTVILASHELQCLLPHDDPLLKKCIDPMDALARSAVRWAKSAKDTQEFR